MGWTAAAERGPTVFAAASLKEALDAVNAAWSEETGRKARISYGGTPALAKQIALGAPADIFISANEDWMDYVEATGRAEPGTRRGLLANRIVLIAPQASNVSTEIGPGFPLRRLLGSRRLAMADVEAVPAGKYGKSALQALGVWRSVEDRIVQTQNVRGALALVARAEAPLGIVYLTDAAAESRVQIVAMLPAGTHPPIVYPMVQLSSATDSAAKDFARFLVEDRAAAIFRDHGFEVLRPK